MEYSYHRHLYQKQESNDIFKRTGEKGFFLFIFGVTRISTIDHPTELKWNQIEKK